MASLLDMTREEREQYVVQLYKENNSIREIARLHMSFRHIGTIINKAKSQAELERGYINDEDTMIFLLDRSKASWQDPVKYNFAHGGKDEVPYPIARKTYDNLIRSSLLQLRALK